MGIRYLIVIATVVGICVLAPVRPVLGLYGYYWFAMMRPDVLSWAGPNRYSMLIAVVTLLSNVPGMLRNLPMLVLNSILRNLLLFFLAVTISVVVAVDPSLCFERYNQFLRVFLMALIVPLIVTTADQLRWFAVVVAGSLGLLGSKYGLWGLVRGGAVFNQGFGGMLSDNNTMALAFAMAVPLCWYARLLVPWKFARIGFIAAAVCNLAAVVFTHSRGGILASGVGLLVIVLSERRRVLAFLMLAGAAAGIAYMVWDSFGSRMSTLKDPEKEASARSRIELAKAAPKLWMDYPLFGVGFTETNEQRLIFKYVPPQYAVAYAGKVLHNNWLQILVDSGIFAFLLYVWLLLSTAARMWSAGRRLTKEGKTADAAIPLMIAVSLMIFAVGSTFLSRTIFDLFYVLLCTAAAWLEIAKKSGPAPQQIISATASAALPLRPQSDSSAPAAPNAPAAPAGRSLRGGLIRLR
jgi:probable O-glycosylation ligase (exosortase A-associated)